MTDSMLKMLIDNPKKMKRYILKEIQMEVQKRMDEFIIDRLFIQLNQE